MSKKFRTASAFSIAATLAVTLFSTDGSHAAAQGINAPVAAATVAPQFISQPVVQQTEVEPAVATDADEATSLAALVEETSVPAALSDELNCLAGAIYFEAKSETLAGQLAVGRVVIARSRSGRFPASYCGVVYQPSQFSFIRGGAMPAVNKARQDWQKAVRIALIADEGRWKSPVEGAMFFHAARLSPRWGKVRMARIDNHVFYR